MSSVVPSFLNLSKPIDWTLPFSFLSSFSLNETNFFAHDLLEFFLLENQITVNDCLRQSSDI